MFHIIIIPLASHIRGIIVGFCQILSDLPPFWAKVSDGKGLLAEKNENVSGLVIFSQVLSSRIGTSKS